MLIHRIDENSIIQRSEMFHMYVLLDCDKIIGVGAVGPYWDSLTESALFNIFILPEYEGKELRRKLIDKKLLENKLSEMKRIFESEN